MADFSFPKETTETETIDTVLDIEHVSDSTEEGLGCSTHECDVRLREDLAMKVEEF